MEPLILRAHHINSAKLLSRMPRREVIDAMERFEYIEHPSDSFINLVYTNLQKYFQELSSLLVLTVGGLDIICESCIKHQKGTCETNKTGEYNLFLSENSFGKSADIQILDKYGLNAGRIYTVNEVRKAANF